MARPKKQKGPGQGRPGIARKYAKDKPEVKTKPVTPTPSPAPQDPSEPEIDFAAPLHALENSTPPKTPKKPLVDNNIYINNNGISKRVVNRRENLIKVDSNNPSKEDSQENKEIDGDKVLIPEIVRDNGFSLKSQLTVKELKFIELYLSGEYTKEKAMIAAGYKGYSKNHLYFISGKIVEKYELQAGDHRKIMRSMGYGEVKILQLLINSATKARSETVRLNARIALAKCIGIQKEVLEGAEGVQIIIRTTARPGPHPTDPQEPPPSAPTQPPAKVRMIK